MATAPTTNLAFIGHAILSLEELGASAFLELPPTDPRRKIHAHSVRVPLGTVLDNADALSEILDQANTKACVISGITAVHQARLSQTFLEKIIQLGISLHVPIFFDFGKRAPDSIAQALWANCVYDPLWHSEKPWSKYWKIHGWHEERWVRYYGESELKNLRAKIKQHEPDFVVFAHSKRAEQSAQF